MRTSFHPLKILALTHADATECCTFARIETPLRELRDDGRVKYRLVPLLPWSVGALRQTLQDLANWDIIWAARPRHYILLPLIREARRLGKPLLVDIDDWLLNVPSDHPDAAFFNTRPRRELIHLALRAADGIMASTSLIADQCARLGLRTFVLPNSVDCTQFIREPRHEGPITIAFCGTATHASDTPLVGPALRHLLLSQSQRVRVVSVGCPIAELQGLEGYTHHAQVPATEYPRLISSLRIDVGLAPLQDTPFNRAKSDIKYLEYSATGAATIASPVIPYLTSVRQDRGVIVPENTAEAWADAIARLFVDEDKRRQLAENAYAWVRGERSVKATANKYYSLFRNYADGDLPRFAPGARQLEPYRFERALANIIIRQSPYDARQLWRILQQNCHLVG